MLKRVPDLPDKEPMQIVTHRDVGFLRQLEVEEKSRRKKSEDLLSPLSPSFLGFSPGGAGAESTDSGCHGSPTLSDAEAQEENVVEAETFKPAVSAFDFPDVDPDDAFVKNNKAQESCNNVEEEKQHEDVSKLPDCQGAQGVGHICGADNITEPGDDAAVFNLSQDPELEVRRPEPEEEKPGYIQEDSKSGSIIAFKDHRNDPETIQAVGAINESGPEAESDPEEPPECLYSMATSTETVKISEDDAENKDIVLI